MRIAIPALAALAGLVAPPLDAANGRWNVDLQAVQLELGGHDRQVLIDRELGAGGAAGAESAATLESESATGYRAEVLFTGAGRWSYGLDFLSHRTNQVVDPRTGAGAGGGARRAFVVGGGQVISDGPGEPLYYERLDDTTVELWTAGLFAARRLGSGVHGELRLLIGVEVADFDNDYRAIAGIGEAGGVRLDASSNYDRMQGPLVGIAGERTIGRHRFSGFLRQSVVLGDVELTSGLREFTGPPVRDVDAALPNVVAGERFQTTDSVTIPITELAVRWRFALGEHVELGAGAYASRWWDVAVPPGVVAGAPLDRRDESTIETYGLSAGIGVRF
jgi:hypothetical protein